jgi:hypothetical protein
MVWTEHPPLRQEIVEAFDELTNGEELAVVGDKLAFIDHFYNESNVRYFSVDDMAVLKDIVNRI